MLKKILMQLFKPTALGAILRIGIFLILFFLCLPRVTNLFQDYQFDTIVLFLTIILVEIFIWRASVISKKPGIQQKKKLQKPSIPDISEGNINEVLSHLLHKRHCALYLNSSTVSIESLLLNYHYLKLDLDALKDIGLELYESRNNIIINTGIDNLNQLINDQEKFISFLMDILRTNHCGSLNVVISISDLINLDNGESEFYIKFHACMQLINTNLNHKININLIVDELSIFEGFYELFDISKQEKAEMFGLSFTTSADDIRAMLSSYSIQFNNLIFRLENMIVQINYKNTADYRRAYMFIYQFSQLRASIARFLECTSLPKKRSFIHQTKKRLITISFINSMKNVQTNAISPAGKFENYFSMVESL